MTDMNESFQLRLNPLRQLVFTGDDGVEHAGVDVVRAFPVSAPELCLSIVSRDGHELAWIPDASCLSVSNKELVAGKLATRGFTPEILKVRSVSSYATPCTWQVETDRGPTRLHLKGEEDVRRLAHPSILISDSRGIQFLIRDPKALDSHSRKILDRFL